jgi:hypothetical protein
MPPDETQESPLPPEGSDALIEISGAEQLSAIALALAGQCSRSLAIVSRHLDPMIYDRPEFAAAVRQLVVTSRHAQVRMVIADAKTVVTRGHRLLELARQLPTFITIRKFGPAHESFNEAWLLADDQGYIRRRHADRHDGIACFRARRTTRELLRQFDEIWNTALPDPELRRLSL